MKLANILEYKKPLAYLENYLIENINYDHNVFFHLTLSKMFRFKNFIARSFVFIRKNFEHVKKFDFAYLDASVLAEVVLNPQPNLRSEMGALEMICFWAAQDKINRKVHVERLLKNVRFDLIPINTLNHWFKGDLKVRKCFRRVIENAKKKSSQNRNVSNQKPIIYSKEVILYNNLKRKFGSLEESNRSPEEQFKAVTRFNKLVVYADNYQLKVFSEKRQNWQDISSALKDYEDFCSCTFKENLVACGGIFKRTMKKSNWTRSYNPRTNRWSDKKLLRVRRVNAACVEFHGGIVILGGYSDGGWLRSVERCDGSFSGKHGRKLKPWERWPDMMDARFGHSAVVIKDKLFVVGGDRTLSCEVFDLISSSFTRINDLPNGMQMQIITNKVATVGSEIVVITSEWIYCYSLQSDSWSTRKFTSPKDNLSYVLKF